MKKTFLYASVVVLFFIVVKVINYNFFHDFEVGRCLQADDGYIWKINSYSLGNYYVVGWQEHVGYWGNEVDIEKSVLERQSSDSNYQKTGVKKYHPIVCPLLGQTDI